LVAAHRGSVGGDDVPRPDIRLVALPHRAAFQLTGVVGMLFQYERPAGHEAAPH